MSVFTKPCPWCLDAIKAGIAFQELLRCYEALELYAAPFGGPANAKAKINVNTLGIVCLKCKGTQRILNEQGEEMLRLFSQQQSTEIVSRFDVVQDLSHPDSTEGGIDE